MTRKEEIQCCIICKHYILNNDLTPRCACVSKIDVVTGKRIYESCDSARILINGYKDNLDCEFFKKRITFFDRIKLIFTK